MITVCGQTFVGAAKSVNQDAYCALSAETSLGDAALLAVCDGVGGLASGEVASSAAIRELSRWFEGGASRLRREERARRSRRPRAHRGGMGRPPRRPQRAHVAL